MARNSAVVNCWWMGSSTSESTPPDAHTLITFALRRNRSRAALAHSSGPSANRIRPSRPEKSRIQSSGKECRSAWPPVVLRMAPAPYIAGPSIMPSATARAR